jgi:hypothetical protein
MLVISDVRGSGSRLQGAACELHGRDFATSICVGPICYGGVWVVDFALHQGFNVSVIMAPRER